MATAVANQQAVGVVGVDNVKYAPDSASKTFDEYNDIVEHFQSRIITIEHDGTTVFLQKAWADGEPKQDRSVWRISLGPLDIIIGVDLAAGSVSLKVVLNLPILGAITVADVSGSLSEGIEISVGFPSVLGGTVGVKVIDSYLTLVYDVTVFGLHYADQLPLFKI